MANGMAASHDGFGGLYRLAGALALAVPSFSASTQAADRLASNSGHAVIAPSYVARAQGFTTGSEIGGYGLESAELFLGLVPSSELSYEFVTLHADDAGMPGDLVTGFANPENLAVGWNTFQAPAGTVLAADTTYYVIVNLQADAGLVFGLGVTAGIGEPLASDWSVEDMSWSLRDDGHWGADRTSVLQFSLTGAPHGSDPPPSARSADAAATGRAADSDEYAGAVVATVANVGPIQVPVSGAGPPRMHVSNSGQPPSAWSRSVMGQGFTTGTASQGYKLGSIELYLESPPPDGLTMPLVTLHADEAGSPGELLARFMNPASYTARANRFWAPFGIVLDPNRTYHVVANLGTDAPQAFSLVTSGKSDVPTGDPEWGVQTGSWLLGSDWMWRANENHGLRFALYEPGENDPSVFVETRRRKSPTSHRHRNRRAHRMNLPPRRRLHRRHRQLSTTSETVANSPSTTSGRIGGGGR